MRRLSSKSSATMNDYLPQEDHQPVTWLRGHPIYAAHLVVLGFVVSMLATTALMYFKAAYFWGWLPFSSAEVLKGQAWRIATYGLVNQPSLWFAIDMAMIALFGRELERIFGRGKFLLLYACIYFIPPLLFTLLGRWFDTLFMGETGAFALFVAYATLYPDAVMIFGVLAKWAAAVLVAIYSLMAIADHDWKSGVSLWVTTGIAFLFVRHERGLLALPRVRLPWGRPKFRVIQGSKDGDGAAARPTPAGPMAEVDALLDKIARSGLSSLTSKERATLDSAREALMKRESGR
jgi:membrane associated rhomboid family serine protease